MYQMYQNDTEYRQYFREITGMRNKVYHTEPGHIDLNKEIPVDIDDITLDEYMYDEEAVSNTLEKIYADTKNEPKFQTLYELAAAKMISLDREIGLTVLMTYDYLWHFIQCYTAFIQEEKGIQSESFCEKYERVKSLLA